MRKEIPIVFGKNLVQVRASYKNKSGYIKINLDDDVINDFFTKTIKEGLSKEPNKRIFLVVEDTPMIIQGEFKPYKSKEEKI